MTKQHDTTQKQHKTTQKQHDKTHTHRKGPRGKKEVDSESTMAEAVKMADVVDDTEDFPDYEDDSSECG